MLSQNPDSIRAAQMQRVSQHGFALVLALSLMAFVLVLLLSISTLVQVESRSASITIDQLKARQNALLALNIALGQLQKAAGPDQRITARAEILDTGSTTLQNTVVKQPLWTGVWETGSDGLDTVSNGSPQRQSSFQASSTTPTITEKVASATWLVSNPTPTIPLDPTSYAGTTTGANPTAVTLAKAQGTNAIDVTAPLVPISTSINGTGDGRFAYWVSDESVKAKVNLLPGAASALASSGTTAENKALNARHFLAPATVAADLALDPGLANDFPIGTSATDIAKLSKLITPSSVLNFPSSPVSSSLLKTSDPDFTTWSQGVLADVRKGGLKTDLTAAFESVQTDAISSTLSQYEVLGKRSPPGRDETAGGPDDTLQNKLWRIAGVPLYNTIYSDGLRWGPFYNYYNLYKVKMPRPANSINPLNPVSPSGLGGIGGDTVDMRMQYRDDTTPSSAAAIAAGRLLPAFVGFRQPLYFSTYNKGAGELGIRLHYAPQLILKNPWNVTIRPGTDPTSGFTDFHFNSNLFGMTSLLEITKQSTGEVIYSGRPMQVENNSFGPRNSDMGFAPGEIKIFGVADPSGGPSFTQYGANATDINGLPLVPMTTSTTVSYGTYELPLTATLADTDDIQIAYTTRFTNINRVSWNYKNKTLGSLNPNPDHLNQTATIISNSPAASFMINPGDPPTPLVVLFMRAKGLNSVNTPRPPAFGGAGGLYNPYALQKNSYLWDAQVVFNAAYTETTEFTKNGSGGTYWGDQDVGVGISQERLILREAFDQPLISIGQFRNVDTVFKVFTPRQNDPANAETFFLGSRVPVGISWTNPELAGDQTDLWYQNTAGGVVAVDDVFLNNEALFDKFFFSTVPPATLAASTTYPTEWQDFDQSKVDAGNALLNPRLQYFQPNNVAPSVVDLQDMDKAAAHLLVDGAFNVNSTSIPAWRALFGSLRYTSSATAAYPVPRFISDLTTEPNSDDFTSTDLSVKLRGGRVLNNTQLDALAAAMVDQVKQRGPFLTMADFVNRRLQSGALGASGALQAAIDASGINASALATLGVATDTTGPKPGDSDIQFPSFNENYVLVSNVTFAMPASTAAGAPGVITQADLLQPLAPVLTARGDTFRIRVYGETRNVTTGDVGASAWCEAIVQRLPDFVDQTDTGLLAGAALGNATSLDSLNSNLNSTFGRRFKVVSIRWLNPDEI